MAQCVLILGTPRSGTSCVAGVVHHLSISMGERLMGADDWNPAGYYQDLDFEEILHEAFDGWNFPDWTTSKPGLNGKIAKKIRTLATQRAAAGKPWGVKSNRLIHFMNAFIAGAGEDVRVIMTKRPIADSIASWTARTEIADGDEMHPVRRMATAINCGLAQMNITPALIVDYNALLADPAAGVNQIAAVCGVPITQEAIDFVNVDFRRFTNE